MRTEIHELTAKNNCLLKEYTDELQKEDKDINYISKISNQISNNESKLNYKKYDFEKNCEYLSEKSSLLDGFTGEPKEHILNVGTCCPKETLEKSEYLKAKASDLEKNLSYDEKRLLSIEDDTSRDKLNNFRESTKLEESIKEDYENYTSLDPEGIVNRRLIYTPIERDKNEDTDGRRTALGEKDQLYEENLNKNDRTNLELSSDNTMDSKKVLSQTEEQNIDENEVINSEETLEEKQNQNYLTNEETENNKVLEENLVNDSKVDIENDEIKVRDEAAVSEASGEDSVLKDANENLEQNQDCEDENFEISETADDNNDMLSFDDNLEKLDNENCDENEELKDCVEETIESSVNCNGMASSEESDEDLDEDEDEFYDY